MLLISCEQSFKQAKFNKTGWNEKVDWDYPNREVMLDDLIKNHQVKGLSYKQLENSIGLPDSKEDFQLYYDIITDFGSDIDPVYTKSLLIKLNKDSVVSGFEVKEWKKD